MNQRALLSLIWLASPALPVGGFSYSEGLEFAVHEGLVTSEASTADWLIDQLHLTLARGDLAVLNRAIGAWRRDDRARAMELNEWVLNTRESAEFRLQTEQMGRSMLEWLKLRAPEDDRLQFYREQSPCYPVAFALAVALTTPKSLEVQDALFAYAFGWAENMVQAAVRAVPLGQSAGQRILARLSDEIPAAVRYALQLRESERQAFAPTLAIFSAQHETQYSRLFRS